ncbi:hypothetical protein CTI12_AA240370 [Artemisia annua]|uniref:Uncharacterized protein n=1 Tax=Artemisia annua TaxID=35608 RepID=A0A2U1NQF2_ARTAN|nr:hypothetical protein CTI12_AA240370 [Artemisia annua]
MDSSQDIGAFKAELDAIKMDMDRVSELAERVAKHTTSVERIKKKLRKKLDEVGNPGYGALFRSMEEDVTRASCLAQTATISCLKRLSKMQQEASCGSHEQQLEKIRKMQQDARLKSTIKCCLESLRKRLDEIISSNYYAQPPNQPEMLTKMQQDVSAAFDCCLECLRNTQVVEELD